MPRIAQSKRQRRMQRKVTPAQRRAGSGATQPTTQAARQEAAESHETTLQLLVAKQRLTRRQEFALRWYGVAYRHATMPPGDLASCLGNLDRVDRSGSADTGAPGRSMTAEWLAECRREYSTARSILGVDVTDFELDALVGTVIACDLIAGRDLHPRDVTTDQRQQAELESSIRLAGDLLGKRWIWLRDKRRGWA